MFTWFTLAVETLCCQFWKHWYKQHFSLNLDVGDLGGWGKKWTEQGFSKRRLTIRKWPRTMPVWPCHQPICKVQKQPSSTPRHLLLCTQSRKLCLLSQGSLADLTLYKFLGGEINILQWSHSTDLYSLERFEWYMQCIKGMSVDKDTGWSIFVHHMKKACLEWLWHAVKFANSCCGDHNVKCEAWRLARVWRLPMASQELQHQWWRLCCGTLHCQADLAAVDPYS